MADFWGLTMYYKHNISWEKIYQKSVEEGCPSYAFIYCSLDESQNAWKWEKTGLKPHKCLPNSRWKKMLMSFSLLWICIANIIVICSFYNINILFCYCEIMSSCLTWLRKIFSKLIKHQLNIKIWLSHTTSAIHYCDYNLQTIICAVMCIHGPL